MGQGLGQTLDRSRQPTTGQPRGEQDKSVGSRAGQRTKQLVET
jgi:hypothetical protein